MMKPQIKEVPSLNYKQTEIKQKKNGTSMRSLQSPEIKWRSLKMKERFLLTSSIRKNNIRCLKSCIMYSLLPAAFLAAGALFIHYIVSAVIAGCYVLALFVYYLCLQKKCMRVWLGKTKCADAACFRRDDEYQYTVNGFSYFVNVFRLSTGNERRVFKLPVYKSTFMYSNSGDNMLAVRFSKNDIKCFSKKELRITSHKPRTGSWSKLSKSEIAYVVKKEKVKLKESQIIFGVNFSVMSVLNILVLVNAIRFFPYTVALLLLVGAVDAVRIRKYSSRIRRLKRTKVNALKNAVVSVFVVRKPTGRGGFNYIHYMKIMHPETGKFRIERLKRFTWVTPFDNEVSDNIIVVDYGKHRRGRSMQHYILEEYYNERYQGSDI